MPISSGLPRGHLGLPRRRYCTTSLAISGLSAECSVVEDIEKSSEYVSLAGIDDPEFHDSTRTPVHNGGEISDWNQQLTIETLENLREIRDDSVPVLVVVGQVPVANIRVPKRVQPELKAEGSPLRIATGCQLSPHTHDVVICGRNRSTGGFEEGIEGGDLHVHVTIKNGKEELFFVLEV